MGEATPRYREIRGSLSKKICMSNTRRGVYSMNKLTCQHKSLPSVHTAPTWLRVSDALPCTVTLKQMLDKWLFANPSSTRDTKEDTTTPAGVAGGNRAGTRHCPHQCCCSPGTSVSLSSPQGLKPCFTGFRSKCTLLIRCSLVSQAGAMPWIFTLAPVKSKDWNLSTLSRGRKVSRPSFHSLLLQVQNFHIDEPPATYCQPGSISIGFSEENLIS